jgi:hypothetical protein
MDTAIEETTEDEMIKAFISAAQQEMNTAIPCKVEAFDKDKGTVDVVPALNRTLPDFQGNYESEQLPKMSDVLIVYPRCQQFAITFPIAVGDYGLLIVCQRNIGNWRSTGNQGDPGDLGVFTLDGAVFLPGLFPDSLTPAQSADANNMVIGSDRSTSSQIVIKPGGEIDAGASATNFVAMANKVKAWFDTFNAAVTGWTPVSNDGGAALKTALTALIGGTPPTNVASTNLKAEG